MRVPLLLAAATTLAAVTLAVSPALAERPGPNWVKPAKVITELESRGYQLTKIEADDGRWEGEAIKAGVKYDFHADPRTGRILRLERDRHD